MAVLIFAESDSGFYKKSTFEAISYGRKLADQLGTTCIAISIGNKGTENLGSFGAHQEVLYVNELYQTFNPQSYAKAISQTAQQLDCNVIIFLKPTPVNQLHLY